MSRQRRASERGSKVRRRSQQQRLLARFQQEAGKNSESSTTVFFAELSQASAAVFPPPSLYCESRERSGDAPAGGRGYDGLAEDAWMALDAAALQQAR